MGQDDEARDEASDLSSSRTFSDRSIRTLLEQPPNLADLLESLLPEIVGQIDFARAKPVRRDFVLEDWRGRESDVLVEIPLRDEDRDLLICVRVEHQSTPDPRMPLRILLYAVLYWERQWKDWQQQQRLNSEELRLRPILPIVFYTGHGHWRTGRRLSDLFDAPGKLAQFTPDWPILFWEVSEHASEELLEMAGEFMATMAVIRAERENADEFRRVFREVLRRLEPLASEDRMRWHDLATFVLAWGFRRRPRSERAELKRVAVESQQTAPMKGELETMSSTLDLTFDEYLVSVDLQARREDLRSFLQARFGRLPKELVQRIDTMTDAEQLKACIEQAGTIQSLDELSL